MTTVNDFTDILRIIREQPEWGDALRSALLSQKLLELPERFAEFAETANKRFAALEGDVAELKAGQDRMEARQDRMESDIAELKAGQARLESTISHLQGAVGNLRGSSYQLNVKTKIASIVTQRLGLDEIRVLKGSLVADDNAFFRLLLNAVAQGIITEQERGEVLNADVILQGRRQSDQSLLYMLLEVSITVAGDDITRADERADIMARAVGEETTPAVVSVYVDNARQRLASERNVTLIAVSE
jgi:outer membrane murein-binding lipoprotein Lpp